MTDRTFSVRPTQGGNPLLLTIAQVADLLNLGRTKTYELVMSNRIKSVKLGRCRRVTMDSVEKYVSELSDESEED